MSDRVDIVTEIRPWCVKPGECMRIKAGPTSFILVFHGDEDRLAWLDAMDEKIFDLNHPKVEARP